MIRKYLLLYLACFVGSTVAREAIVGGSKAKADEFPYEVTLFEHAEDMCGGGIIGEQHIITAAHCIIQENGQIFKDRKIIVAGVNEMGKFDKPAVIAEIRKIYVPKEYNPKHESSVADIAVIKLKNRLEFSKSIHKLELPKNKHENYTGKTAKIAGFGWDWVKPLDDGMIRGHNTDNYLRYANADILPPNHKNYEKKTVVDKQICARVKQYFFYRKGAGVCYGDSGSPLVLDNVVIGILSTSPPSCSEKEYGAIYTRVTNYLNFVQNAVRDKKHKDIRVYEMRSEI